MKGKIRNSSGGFTLIELLVVVAIILVLAAVVFIGMGKATKTAHRAESIGNIKELSAIVIAGASDNNGLFPEMHYDGIPFKFRWQWREDANITREMAYASGNRCWTQEGVDVCSKPKKNLWDWGGREGEASVFGYACLVNDNGWADEGEFSRPDNWSAVEPRVTTENDNGDVEVRWVPERLGQEVAYPILWTDLSATWANERLGNFMHGRRDQEMEGTHVGYLQGHVEWVRGRDLKARYRGSGVTLFW